MKEFLDKVKSFWEQKARVEAQEDLLDVEATKLEAIKKDLLKMMDAVGLDKQALPGYGTISRQKNFSVKVPSDPINKVDLFKWIEENKGEDVLFAMQTIHSNTLNSFYKQERELAIERGDESFKIPGLAEPGVYYTLKGKRE